MKKKLSLQEYPERDLDTRFGRLRMKVLGRDHLILTCLPSSSGTRKSRRSRKSIVPIFVNGVRYQIFAYVSRHPSSREWGFWGGVPAGPDRDSMPLPSHELIGHPGAIWIRRADESGLFGSESAREKLLTEIPKILHVYLDDAEGFLNDAERIRLQNALAMTRSQEQLAGARWTEIQAKLVHLQEQLNAVAALDEKLDAEHRKEIEKDLESVARMSWMNT